MDNAPNKKSVLLVTTLGSFLTSFMVSSINVALPSIGNELAMDAILLSWVATSYLLGVTVFLIPFGRIADIYGRKRIFAYGIIMSTVVSFILAILNSAVLLIVFRVVQGMGAAMVAATSVAILTSVYGVGERGRAMGIMLAATYLGVSLGPFLGGLLTQYLGWRSIFLANIPLGLLVIVFVYWKLEDEWAEAMGEKFDLIGSIILGMMVVMIIYGFSLLPAIPGLLLIFIGAAVFIGFVKWEARIETPVLDVNLFRENRVFAFSSLAALINYSAIFAVMFLLSLYLQYIKGFSPQSAGFVLVAQPFIQSVFSPVAGRMSDRIQPHIVASVGMALTALGLLLFVFLSGDTTLPSIVTGLILIGFGVALFVSPNTNAIMSSVDNRFYGVASAITSLMRNTGMMFSMGIVMLIFALYIGSVQITPQYYGLFLKSVRTAFIILTILCFCGIFASLARAKTNEVN